MPTAENLEPYDVVMSEEYWQGPIVRDMAIDPDAAFDDRVLYLLSKERKINHIRDLVMRVTTGDYSVAPVGSGELLPVPVGNDKSILRVVNDHKVTLPPIKKAKDDTPPESRTPWQATGYGRSSLAVTRSSVAGL